jgi:putative PIN family toxin of toxin-antitoxin system
MNTARAGRLRVVLDSNVYVSAFMDQRGSPFRSWRAALEGHYILLTSPQVVDELAGVLKLVLGWDDPKVTARIKLLVKVAEIIVPRISLNEITKDDDDNRILECAVAGKADLIVSGDHHLTELKSFREIGIVRPADFQRILGLGTNETKR